MIKYLSISIILIVTLLITSCARSEKGKAEILLEVENIEINAWLNFMPGVSPGKFHLTGEVTLQNQSDEPIKNFGLSNITVYSSEEIIYSFKPYITNKMEGDNLNLNTRMDIIFSFGMAEGLKIDERLAKNKIINVNLNFVSDKGSYSFSVDRIKVEEAY
ncbi:MAG: hypothetical protein WBH40_07200 [Ignavibacteriaceae bacterium]